MYMFCPAGVQRKSHANGEKWGDYATIMWAFSVLKLSNNFVSGYITSCYKGEETMSLEEFQKLLNSIK